MTSLLRKVAGLPEPTDAHRRTRTTRTQTTGSRGLFAQAEAGAGSTGSHAVWEPIPEDRRALLWQRLLRGLLAATLAILCLLGIRTLVQPAPRTPPTPSVPPTASYPSSEAQGVAARWTTAYLTLDPKVRTGRQAALHLDAPALDQNWDGKGAQKVLGVHPGRVEVAADGKTATVTVMARVQSGKRGPTWVTMGVPTALNGQRVVVSGPGAFMPMPAPTPAPLASKPATDSQFTAATEQTVRAFMATFATGTPDQLAQITAPGTTIAPLGGGLTLRDLRWQAFGGASDHREGVAVATWATSAGAQLKQSYRVELTAVSAANTTSWRVSAIRPDVD